MLKRLWRWMFGAKKDAGIDPMCQQAIDDAVRGKWEVAPEPKIVTIFAPKAFFRECCVGDFGPGYGEAVNHGGFDTMDGEG